MSERFLTRAEAAELMRLDYRTLGNLAAKRAGPPFLKTSAVRGKALYREADVIAYLTANGQRCGTSSTATSSSARSTSKPAKARSPRQRKTANVK
jgi:hypothetical protein